MIGDTEQFEPEGADLTEHTSLVRDAAGENPIERTDAVRGYDQQLIAKVVNISDFAPFHRDGRQIRFQQRCPGHGSFPHQGWRRLEQ